MTENLTNNENSFTPSPISSSDSTSTNSPSIQDFDLWKRKINDLSDKTDSLNKQIEQLDPLLEETNKLAQSAFDREKGLTTKIKDLENKIAETENKNKAISRALYKAEHSVRKMSREVKITERKSLEFLGIFATLFTFISVSASTILQFKNVHHAIFFLASFCLCLLLFLHLFHIIIRNEKIGKFCWFCFYFAAFIICGGGAFFCYYQGKDIQNTKDDNKNSIQINYTQTNGYEQNISPLVQQKPPTSN